MMNFISMFAIGACVLLAINVGGNNSAAMGPAFGSGLRSWREAIILIAIFSMIGAVTAGDHVVKTVGSDLIGSEPFRSDFRNVTIVLLSATSIIALANWLRVPIATAHAMVGSVIGLGLFYGSVHWPAVLRVVLWWLATPVVAMGVSFFLGKFVYARLDARLAHLSGTGGPALKIYRAIIVVSGCYMAFSAGSNSLAKAVGPVIGAGILSMRQGSIVGGLCMAVGALVVGHRLMKTVGREITPLDPLKATMVELVCGTILIISSFSGVPVSLAETATCAVVGFGAAHAGVGHTSRNRHLRRIYILWPVCPLFTAAASYAGAFLLHKFA